MPTLKIKGLILRPIERRDAPRFAELCNDALLARNTSRIPFPYTLEDATNFVKRATSDIDDDKEYRFAVCRNEEIIACTGLMVTAPGVYELGYWVGRQARGQGVATLAASAAVQYAFETLDAATINAGYFFDNPASGRILTKLGFKPTGETIKTHSLARRGEVDTIRLLVTPSAFKPIAPSEIVSNA